MSTICGADCAKCQMKDSCRGCSETNGSPFGGKCIAAQCIKKGGCEAYEALKQELINEINDLGIDGMPEVTALHELPGFFVNLEYTLPNGEKAKLIGDENVYLGTQIELPGGDSCRGLVADEDFLLVCDYGRDGAEPEILLFKRR